MKGLFVGSKSYFPRLKRRRWTSSASSQEGCSTELINEEEECIEAAFIMSSDPEKNKQSIMLNSDCVEVLDCASMRQNVTLGAGPPPCS